MDTDHHPDDRTERTGPAVRLVVGMALALPQLMTGVWGVVATRHWFERFPGVGAALVAGEPPFNRHLAADAAAGFLATGVALGWAALDGRRSALRLAVVTYLAFAVPHVVYHAGHDAPALSAAARAANVALLGSGVVIAAGALWATRTHGSRSHRTDPEPNRVAAG